MHKEYFEVVLADDEWSRKLHYQLRYQVFCVETGYEDPAQFPDGEERDEWDEGAVHFLVRERESERYVAAMRLIIPQNDLLPINIRTHLDETLNPPKNNVLEISRLCMVGHYRRRLQGQALPCEREDKPHLNIVNAKDEAETERRKRMRTTEILRALLGAAVAYSKDSGAHHWYMFITKALSKVIGHVLHLDLQQVGEPAWHKGERFPFVVNVEHLFEQFAQVTVSGPVSERHRPAYRLHSELVAASMPRAVGAL